jgi:hypothetical protein
VRVLGGHPGEEQGDAILFVHDENISLMQRLSPPTGSPSRVNGVQGASSGLASACDRRADCRGQDPRFKRLAVLVE